jgi:glycosyltransferase involved in cell wall biosynthesis
MKKLRVALICQFSNQDVRGKLPLSKLAVRNAIRRFLGKQPTQVDRDFAPWVSNLIKEFEKIHDLELHVIAPHAGMTSLTYEYCKNGVSYHFFKSDLFFIYDMILRRWSFLPRPKYRLNRFLVHRFLNRIKPDVVDLVGTENPYYSITALDIEQVPVYVSVQTVYTNPDRKKYSGECDPFRWDTELDIHKKVTYYGSEGRMHRDLILRNNPDAVVLKATFCKEQPALVDDVNKTCDFIFYAAYVLQGKGIEDAIQALSKVKMVKNDVFLDVVGGCAPQYKAHLERLIEKLNMKDNVHFRGYFPLQSDMFKHIQCSSFAVLPIKLDSIPGTVIEAMFLELPVVTYRTSGTPYLNKEAPCVLLADIGDVDALAGQMIKLLQSPVLAQTLKRNAKAFALKEYDSTACAQRIVRNYKAVIEHYHRKTPIPDDLLFDINEFPVY